VPFFLTEVTSIAVWDHSLKRLSVDRPLKSLTLYEESTPLTG
jgi:hypothetical protein